MHRDKGHGCHFVTKCRVSIQPVSCFQAAARENYHAAVSKSYLTLLPRLGCDSSPIPSCSSSSEGGHRSASLSSAAAPATWVRRHRQMPEPSDPSAGTRQAELGKTSGKMFHLPNASEKCPFKGWRRRSRFRPSVQRLVRRARACGDLVDLQAQE